MTDGTKLRLEDLKPGLSIEGLTPTGSVKILHVEHHGTQAAEITYKDPNGPPQSQVLYRDDMHRLRVASAQRLFAFDGDGANLRLMIEAHRIARAHHFDPYLALHTSFIEPLPHQITAVYEAMLPRHPLRFLLADDPGAGKTIVAGLLIKELIARGDLDRCLVIAPGNLVEQWQDELGEKFHMEFSILTRDMIEGSRSGNPFNDRGRLIARLDQLARDKELQAKLEHSSEWDLIVCDEAHRMSASYFGKEVKSTKRYQLGKRLGRICRHLLLMSATPHNGKEADFQLFMALLDSDRFGGRFHAGAQQANATDMMRRLTKEELLQFDGTPIFPERRAYTVHYELSAEEAALYGEVTEYVCQEMNRAQRFAKEDGRRKNTIGFALQILQRRLASSPAAIYHSLQRRRERLQNELDKARLMALGKGGRRQGGPSYDIGFHAEDLRHIEEYSEDVVEALEEKFSSLATSAESVEQREIEVEKLKELEQHARDVLRSGKDTKWTELNKILDDQLMRDTDGARRKLIVFTEAKDTLQYLADKIAQRLGREEAVGVIHGGLSREARRNTINRFMQDRTLMVLVANDAAGEGVNLQRGHLMVNYDLPWNPNKIEQRFGRIHRIGQTEVCHLWNLVATNTREGDVYGRLLEKLETARRALQGRVYDVLGEMFEGASLKDLLWEAVQYGNRADVKARLMQKIEGAVDQTHIADLVHRRKLTDDMILPADVMRVRTDMERAAAIRLQPHHVQGFFIEAFTHLRGRLTARGRGRFELTHVPFRLRQRDREIGTRAPLQPRYERIAFDKAHINRQPVAEFVCPGHPLLDAVISLVQEDHAHLLRQGAVMVNETDPGTEIRVIFLLEHSIEDGRQTRHNKPQVISSRLFFAAINSAGRVHDAGIAPHLDLRPATDSERALAKEALAAPWLTGAGVAELARRHAITHLAQKHLNELRPRRLQAIAKVEREVKNRLRGEINHWDRQAIALQQQEREGEQTPMTSQQAHQRANMLAERMQQRLAELAAERAIRAQAPVVLGGMVAIPRGFLAQQQGGRPYGRAGDPGGDMVRDPAGNPKGDPGRMAPPPPGPGFSDDPEARQQIEAQAMAAVMQAERRLGNTPRDVSAEHLGYDIQSHDPHGRERFIEVKGRIEGADSIMVTRNEIITGLNEPEAYILAVVFVAGGVAQPPRYIWHPFEAEPAFAVTQQVFDLRKLLRRAQPPA